jgi:uncharacterized membrane protein
VAVLRVTLGVMTVAGVLWAAAIAAVPAVVASQRDGGAWRVSALVYAAGAAVCHQRPERSFHLAGVQGPVCARCTGLYVGGALALLLWPVARRVPLGSRRGSDLPQDPRAVRAVVLIVAAPTLATVVSAALGVYDPSNAWRAALALPLGSLAGIAVSAVLLEDLR